MAAHTSDFTHASPQQALDAIKAALRPVPAQCVSLDASVGLVLAEPILADRPSPACDVSAMDGYAVRLADLEQPTLEIAGEARIGMRAPDLPADAALRVYTGSMVPPGAEAVIRREDVEERECEIGLTDGARGQKRGTNIRFQGENVEAGTIVVAAGEQTNSSTLAALASFGAAEVMAHQRVRVSIFATGDELRRVDERPDPWQIRESNTHTLRALLGPLPWIELVEVGTVRDEPKAMRSAFAKALETSDALVLSGGVSMGQRDHVAAVLAELGCETILHRLPIRPGKPLLATIGSAGQLVLGLPGNPVSVMTTAHRFALPALRRLAGFARTQEPDLRVEVAEDDGKRIGLWWYRQVRLVGDGRAQLVPSKGSGDLVSVAATDGFIEIAPNESTAGLRRYWPWR